MVRLLQRAGVQRVVGDQCRYGLKIKHGDEVGLARKRPGFLTNSSRIARALCKKCPNRRIQKVHDHIILESGRTKAAQVYPPELCHAICKGLEDQLEADQKGQFVFAELEGGNGTNGKGLMQASKDIHEQCKIAVEDNDERMAVAWDDVSRGIVRPKQSKGSEGRGNGLRKKNEPVHQGAGERVLQEDGKTTNKRQMD